MDNLFFYLFFLLSVLVSAISQVMLKKAAIKEYGSFIQQYVNPLVISAYGLFFLSTVLTVVIYRFIPLSIGTVLESTSYLYITLFGYVIFREKITLRKFAAVACIVSGSVICALLG